MRRGFTHAVAVLACVAAWSPAVAHAQGGGESLLRLARVEEPRSVGIGRVIPDLDLLTLRGEKRTLAAELKDRKAVVIAIVGATCPMSIEYSPRLAKMEKDWADRGVGFVFVNAVEAETTVDMEAQVLKHRLRGPYVADKDKAVCRALGVRTTTEAFLVDASRTLVFRGAVDDQHGIGGSLPAPRNNYLADAVEALLAGARPRVRATSAPGCLVDCAEKKAPAGAGPDTYTGKIAWIMAENCVSCHRAGGAAPFSLDSYEAVSGRAKMIGAVVRDGLMPPWHGSTHEAGAPSPWVTDRSLAAEDKDALLAWLGSDRPRGTDAARPELPPLSRTWAIGEPDLIVTSSGLRLAAQGGLQHARVMVGFPLAEDKWLTAAEFRPVESGSMHHALVWILAPGDALPRPEEMPARLELLGTYSPGDNVLRYPSGVARRIRAGSIFLVDLYAQPMGKEVISALRIGMKWGAEPKWHVRSIGASAAAFEPGSRPDEVVAKAELALTGRARVLALTPYLRARGRSFTVDARSGTGASERLLDAPRWDVRWQIRYEFVEPRELDGPLSIRGVFRSDAGVGEAAVLGSGAAEESLLLSAEILEPLPARSK